MTLGPWYGQGGYRVEPQINSLIAKLLAIIVSVTFVLLIAYFTNSESHARVSRMIGLQLAGGKVDDQHSYVCLLNKLVPGHLYAFYNSAGELSAPSEHPTLYSDLIVPHKLNAKEIEHLQRMLCRRNVSNVVEEMALRCSHGCNVDWNAYMVPPTTPQAEYLSGPKPVICLGAMSHCESDIKLDLPRQTYWYETDLEPDDLMALKVLPLTRYVMIDSHNRFMRSVLHQYYRTMNRVAPTCICGESTSKFGEYLLRQVGVSDLLGKESPVTCAEGSYEEYFEAFAHSIGPVMVSMKPMRELFAWYRRDRKAVTALLGRVTLYAYGGYNFRSLTHGTPELEYEFLEMLQSFKSVNVYESFYATGKNSINHANSPEFYKMGGDLMEMLSMYAKFWNEYLVTRQRKRLVDESDLNAVYRVKKTIESIEADPEQYLLADSGLAVAMVRGLKSVPVRISFRGGYTMFKRVDESRMFYYGEGLYFGEMVKMLGEGLMKAE